MSRRYHDTMLQLQALENMRFAALAYGAIFTAADIRQNTDKELLNQFELYHLSDYQIFGTGVPPEFFAFLLDGAPLNRLHDMTPCNWTYRRSG